jgi:hypothetical protein
LRPLLLQNRRDGSGNAQNTYEWFQSFRNGRMSIDDEVRCVPLLTGATENMAELREPILGDRRLAIGDV